MKKTKEELEAIVASYNKVTIITRRQCFLALNKAGVLQSVKDMIAASDDEDLKLEWETASVFDINWEPLGVFAFAFGWDQKQLDDLFELASTL